jgi:3-oxoacyl-[acyl-carrier protein] reductase
MTSGNDSPAVLVVGGGGGLGASVCRLLAERGEYPLVGWAHDEAKATAVAERTGGLPVHVDLAVPTEAVEAALEAAGDRAVSAIVLAGAAAPALETFGRLDVAALEERIRSEAIGAAEFLGPLVKTWMKPRRSGAVVAVLSAAMGTPERAAMGSMAGYVIAKYALAGTCAALGADHPWLTVHTVSPGFMDTPMLDAFDARFVEGLRKADRIEDVDAVAADIVGRVAAPVP